MGEDGAVSSWSVVVPLKRLVRAKSRLRGAVPAASHERLVGAMLADTIATALATDGVAQVLVVTDEPEPPPELAGLAAVWLPDAVDAGLNTAIEAGAATARRRWRGAGVAALAGDLPALDTRDLGAALRAAGRYARAFVADADGRGTTLLTASPTALLTPRFGVASASAHAESGAAPLADAWPSLRRDVDTAADLAIAHGYGLGPRTAALLAATGVVHHS